MVSQISQTRESATPFGLPLAYAGLSPSNPIDLTGDDETFGTPARHWRDLFDEYVRTKDEVPVPAAVPIGCGSGDINKLGDMVLPDIKALNLRKTLE